ncbi:MAG: M48 family metalloprotease [Gemmatimonadaceae bacterium]|nr:M48 family metalloprotease [Gemmatimonadaceae bacterium]
MKNVLLGFAAVVTLTGCGVSAQQELEMGAQTAQEINSQIPLVRDAEINRYVNVLGDSIARLADNRGIDYTFYVVDAMEVNAFAVPGGYIYVNRGLITRTTNLSQLAGVLGHEIGHVVRRHSVQQMQQMQQAQIGVTLACVLTSVCNSGVAETAINVAGGAVFAKFSRDDEREADQEAITNVVRAGIHPDGIPQMFEILLAERTRNPGGVDSWFATHPLEEERVERTRAAIAQINPAVLRTLTRDSQNYQNFKRRVLQLPPAPRTR